MRGRWFSEAISIIRLTLITAAVSLILYTLDSPTCHLVPSATALRRNMRHQQTYFPTIKSVMSWSS